MFKNTFLTYYCLLNIINPLRIAYMNTPNTTGLNKKSHPEGWPQTFCPDFAPLTI